MTCKSKALHRMLSKDFKCKLEEPLNLAYFRRLKRNILLINPYIVRKGKKVYGYEDTRSKTK